MIHSLSKDKALLQIFFWFCLAHGCLHASCLLNLSGHMHACALIDGGENLLASSAQKKINAIPSSWMGTRSLLALHTIVGKPASQGTFRGYGDTGTQSHKHPLQPTNDGSVRSRLPWPCSTVRAEWRCTKDPVWFWVRCYPCYKRILHIWSIKRNLFVKSLYGWV